jgi:hypothetical protein
MEEEAHTATEEEDVCQLHDSKFALQRECALDNEQHLKHDNPLGFLEHEKGAVKEKEASVSVAHLMCSVAEAQQEVQCLVENAHSTQQ